MPFFLCAKDSQLNVKRHSKQTKTFLVQTSGWKWVETAEKPENFQKAWTAITHDHLKMWRQSGSSEAKYKDFYCNVIEKNKLHLSFSSFFLLTHLTVVRQFGTICPFIPTKTMFDFQNTTDSHCRCIKSCGVIKKTSVKYRYCVPQHSNFLKFFHKINFSH